MEEGFGGSKGGKTWPWDYQRIGDSMMDACMMMVEWNGKEI